MTPGPARHRYESSDSPAFTLTRVERDLACAKCGYNLMGLVIVHGRCPECDFSIESSITLPEICPGAALASLLSAGIAALLLLVVPIVPFFFGGLAIWLGLIANREVGGGELREDTVSTARIGIVVGAAAVAAEILMLFL